MGAMDVRPYAEAVRRLKTAGLRPTRQRLGLIRLLFERGDRHVSAEQLHAEAAESGLRVSLATVYNTLNRFSRAGLLREVVIEAGRSYFDTNVTDHHHFYFEADGRLQDIPGDQVRLGALPPLPQGTRLSRVEVIVKVAEDRASPTRGKPD